MTLIKLENIEKKYNPGKENEVHALRGISLEIEKGGLVAITGKSGSGKSTLLHILGCIDTPTAGCYYLDGEDVSKKSVMQTAAIRNKRIGFVLQNFGLLLNRSVRDNILLPTAFSKNTDKKAVSEKLDSLLGFLDIASKKNVPASQLSGGQKQRVAIARALINDPDIILADEPTGALDRKTADDTVEILQSLNADGKTVIIVTHDLQTAEKCGRILTLTDGMIFPGKT